MLKGLLLFVTAICGLVGVTALFYSGVTIFQLDLKQATTDKLDLQLAQFINCEDSVAIAMANRTITDSITKDFLIGACQYKHTPYLTLWCTAGTFALFSVLSGLVSGCRDVKGNLYAYTVISGASLALLVMSIAMMNSVTLSESSVLTTCKTFNNATVENIRQFGYMCVEDNKTATHWLGRVGLFYSGAIISILSLLSFLLMNSCASGKTRSELSNEQLLNPTYRTFNQA